MAGSGAEGVVYRVAQKKKMKPGLLVLLVDDFSLLLNLAFLRHNYLLKILAFLLLHRQCLFKVIHLLEDFVLPQ